jgi:starch phosphorylase
VSEALRETLLTRGDHYMHLADLGSYLAADARVAALRADPEAWTRKAILNVAGAGKFSSERTIAEYARDIWGAEPCPVP